MEEKKMEAELYCLPCRGETVHTIVYINNKLSKIECQACHHLHVISINVKEELYHEILERIISKPTRMSKEYKADLTLFLKSLPIRMLSKPFRVYKEARTMKRYIDEHKM
ncbi:bh protein [Paenibacillus thalictri]|uniref:Bh protein n=1 Tax=Paenibacillus thalictri TaxID=2527873 RepID=A0A4Q9DX42_9BACL|nr:bh protein [Paenibacillus thalictri]TBL81677.1 bh protein [Paenibacillus thalictri]